MEEQAYVLEYLDELGIGYELDNHLVRGLDYYNRTVFEIFAEGSGAEVGALPAGGRYDYLMELLGGNLTPAVGGACGVERLIAQGLVDKPPFFQHQLMACQNRHFLELRRRFEIGDGANFINRVLFV